MRKWQTLRGGCPLGRFRCLGTISMLGFLLASSGPASAIDYEIDRQASIFAVITHRGGLFRAMAHNHLVHPQTYEARLAGTPPDFSDSLFELSFRANDLAVDDHDVQRRWFPLIEAAGILEDPFPEVSAGDRSKIRSSMLGEGQLDASVYPGITASLKGLEPVAPEENGLFTHRATLAFSLHGKTVTQTVPVRIAGGQEALTVEGFGEFRFTGFGIEPFSAFLGAVRNRDIFHVFVHLTARPSL